MPEPLLSLCVPTYNRVHCLRELLPEVLGQCGSSGAADVLVMDNCSTDGTQEYVSGLAARYQFLRYMRNEENIGADRNFLRCIESALGKYVWLVGDDDLIAKDAVERVVHALTAHPDISLLQCRDGNGYRGDRFYESYRGHLADCWTTSRWYALLYTLITCNVFRKQDFDMEYARKKLYTSYAHMFGLRKVFKEGKTGDMYNVIGVRAVREPFSDPVRFIKAKLGLYYLFLFQCTRLYRLLPQAMKLFLDRQNFKEFRKGVKAKFCKRKKIVQKGVGL